MSSQTEPRKLGNHFDVYSSVSLSTLTPRLSNLLSLISAPQLNKIRQLVYAR